MKSVNCYLTFNGNCEEAFEFYRSVLGGEFLSINRFKDMPPQEGMPPIPEEMGNQLMHVTLPVGRNTVLMGSDAGGEWAPRIIEGNNFSLSISTDSREEADRIFAGLSEGGTVTMPMGDTFWGSYFGMFTDRYGINWMVSFESSAEH